MEKRKLIKFGKGSYVISLPIDWVRKYVFSNQDYLIASKNKEKHPNPKNVPYLYLDIDNNGNIIISPHMQERKKQETITSINLMKKDVAYLNRLLTASYVNNYNKIILKGNLPPRDIIRQKVHNLIASEIIEQSHERIVIKDFLDSDEIRPLSLIKKMDNLIRAMFRDYKSLSSVLEYEKDINRLMYLCLRGILYKPKTDESIRLWQTVTFLEKIGDCLKRFSRHYDAINQETGQEGENLIGRIRFRRVDKLLNDVYESYKKIINNFMKKDTEKAIILADERAKLIGRIQRTISRVFDYDISNYYRNHLVELLVNLKELVVYMNDINRLLYLITPKQFEKKRK